MKNCSSIVAQFNVNVNTVHTVNIISVRKFKKKNYSEKYKKIKKNCFYIKSECELYNLDKHWCFLCKNV